MFFHQKRTVTTAALLLLFSTGLWLIAASALAVPGDSCTCRDLATDALSVQCVAPGTSCSSLSTPTRSCFSKLVGDTAFCPDSSNQGKGLGYVGGVITGASSQLAFGIWVVMLYLQQTIATVFLFMASFFLDNLFYFNVVLTPGNISAVQEGWGIMRDVANSAFILIILWIAFTIIFDVENLGGKRLLARVIIIALLINFSLTLVSSVFGIANALARPFRDAIPEDVAGLIIDQVKLQTVFKAPSKTDADNFKAQNWKNKQDCGFAALADRPVPLRSASGCLLASAAVGFTTDFMEGFLRGANFLTGAADAFIALAIGLVFLTTATAVFLAASLMLLTRMVVMVFLSILAPIAFVARVIPADKGMAIWNRWLSALICWAFYAPAFYFLFWVSLLVLTKMSGALPPATNSFFAAYIFAIIPFMVFFAFMIASLRLGRLMGCEGANLAMDIGKKTAGLALQAASFAVTAGAAPVAARVGAAVLARPGVKAGLEGLAKAPGARFFGGMYPARAAERFLAQQREKVAEQEKDVEKITSKGLLFAEARGAFTPERRVAALKKLEERNLLNTPAGEGGFTAEEKARAVNEAAIYGEQWTVLETNPHLATMRNVPDAASNEDAINQAVKRMKDKTKTAREALDNDVVLDALWKNMKSPNEFQKIAREAPLLQNAMMERLQRNAEELRQTIDPRRFEVIRRYLAGILGKKAAAGWELPTAWQRTEGPMG